MRRSRAAAAIGIFAMAPLATGCGDPLGVGANEPVAAVSLGLFPFSAVPPTYASAINTPFRRGATVDASGNFDVALDLDEEGRVVLYPVRTLVTPIIGANRVGLQKVPGPFEDVERAPTGGFVADSVMTILLGEVVVIEAQRTRSGDYCSFAFASNVYSKMVVDFVDPETKLMQLRLTVNPNCGFRSFLEGIPRD